MSNVINICDYKEYIKSQTNICFNSDLFDDKHQHGSKIIMLFAEAFPFLTDLFDINKSGELITEYSNTNVFKHWFWRIKHILGQKLKRDPTFYDIGHWIGKGLFLKIIISLLIYHKIFINDEIIIKIIEKQKKFLNDLIDIIEISNLKNNNLIEIYSDDYYVLDEHVITSYENEGFYLSNLII